MFITPRLILLTTTSGPAISGKANYTGQRKAGAVGRKPLGDLSNSGKLSINQADGRKALDGGKQLKSKKLATVKEEAVVPAKFKNLDSTRTASKVSEKLQTGNRKALSDISNVGKTKNESIQKPSAIAEERCLHNHQECIKSQSEAMGLRHFFKTVGLESGNLSWVILWRALTFTRLYFFTLFLIS